jgi:hypothetical protein
MILFFEYGIGETNLMPTRNRLISKNLQKKRAFEIYFISEVAETVAKRRFRKSCPFAANAAFRRSDPRLHGGVRLPGHQMV